MLRLLLALLLPLLSAILLTSCCGAETCDCQDERADALAFSFSSDSLGGTGFRRAQVDTVLLVRYPHPDDSASTTSPVTKPDTVRLFRPVATVFTSPVVINNTIPFAARANRKLGKYRYAIIVPGSRRGQPPLKRYYVGAIDLQGKLDSDGCCSCYQNTRKTFYLDNTRVDATDPTGKDELIVTTLRR
jgi:hypothetical protein